MGRNDTHRKGQGRTLCTTFMAVSAAVAPVIAKGEGDAAAKLAQELLKLPEATARLDARFGGKKESLFTSKSLFALAFKDGDQKALLDSSGAGGCFSTDVRNQQIDGRGCVRGIETGYFQSAPHTVKQQSEVLGFPTFRTNSVNVDDIKKGAATRFTTRFASETLGRNSFLKVLLEGKVDVTFSVAEISGLFASSSEGVFASKNNSEVRPTYRLVVKYPEHEEEGVRLAALSPVASKALSHPSSLRLQIPSQSVERQIVEEWPTATPTIAEISETPATGSTGLGLYMKRTLKLSSEPFSSFRLKIEREGTTGPAGLSLKLYESSGIASANLTSLLAGNPEGITWEAKAPYGKHAAVFASDGLSKEVRYAYEYYFTPLTRARLSYDPNLKPGTVNNSESAIYAFSVKMVY